MPTWKEDPAIKAWLAFRWADAVLPVSHALQRAIEHYGIRARFHVIPNVVDTTLFVPGSPRQRDPDRKRILFVGQLQPVSGIFQRLLILEVY